MNKIKKDRLKRDLTQLKYSELFGVSVSCVKKWESGKRIPHDMFFLLMTFSTEALNVAHKKGEQQSHQQPQNQGFQQAPNKQQSGEYVQNQNSGQPPW